MRTAFSPTINNKGDHAVVISLQETALPDPPKESPASREGTHCDAERKFRVTTSPPTLERGVPQEYKDKRGIARRHKGPTVGEIALHMQVSLIIAIFERLSCAVRPH